MSEQRMDQQKMVRYLLGAVVVLLVAVIGILFFQSKGATPTPAGVANQVTPSGSTGGAPANPTTGEEAFDPKTATKVPAGKTPEEFLKGYYEAVKNGKYEEAYKMLPAVKQQTQTAEDFAAQLKGYGISGYKIEKPQTNGDEMSIVAQQETAQFGSFGTEWTFVKSGDQWLVKSKGMAGLGGGSGAPSGMPPAGSGQ